MFPHTYSVLVSNVGTVFDRACYLSEARAEYAQCVELSKGAYGRMAGESVTLLCDGEPIAEYQPDAEQ